MLKRKTPMKPGKPLARKSPMNRASAPMKSIGARGKRMRQGKVAPTAEESAWMDAAQVFGCIVCRLQYGLFVPAEIHHLKDGDRRRGHLWTIPLCYPHHRQGNGSGLCISIHPYKKRFTTAYGSEEWLLEQVRFFVAQAGHTIPILPVIMESKNICGLTLRKSVVVR